MGRELRREIASASKPHVGQFVVWGVLLHAIVCMRDRVPSSEGARNHLATIFSFLPEEILTSPLVYPVCRWLLVAAGILWALQLLVPLSSWVCVFAYTLTVAIVFENASRIDHARHLANLVLFVHAMWYHFHANDIRMALARRAFWVSRIYPGWVHALCLFCIGSYHSNAALSKVMQSGSDWPNGLSLQLWVHLLGREHSLANTVILSNRSAAALLQWAVLLVEASALVAFFVPRLRVPVGVALLGLYAGFADSFGFSFVLNAFLVAAFFFPWMGIIDRAQSAAERCLGITFAVARGSRPGRFLDFIVPRLDVLGVAGRSSQPERITHSPSRAHRPRKR